MAFEHQPGMAIECLSIPIKLNKEPGLDSDGREVLKCGFKIGGGIDQDFRKSPQGYKDSGIYVTEVYENSPAAKCGLKIHDKILQFTVQQVSFPSEDLPEDSSSVDSFSSVVDPNVDFFVGSKNCDDCNSESLLDFKEEWNQIRSEALHNEKQLMESKDISACSLENTAPKESYPTIPLAVAQYINKNNPEVYEEAEKYLNFEAMKKTTAQNSMYSMQDDNSPASPLHSMSIASEALALQQSVIGNFGVKPVSADVVAQVVANTKRRMEQETVATVPFLNPAPENTENSKNSKTDLPKLELIRYPSESISSTVEKRSWFSNSTEVRDQTAKNSKRQSPKESHHLSRSSSQTSINSCAAKKSTSTSISSIPRVHLSKGANSKNSKNLVLDDVNSPYEVYPDSSVEYETESSFSEKFEVESLYSEAFETESNFSEVSGIDDEMFQIRKNGDVDDSTSPRHERAARNNARVSGNYERLIHNGTQVNVSTSHANTSPLKSPLKRPVTVDKAVEADDSFHFELLREKANLEGRLESVSQDQSSLVRERDHFRSLANSFEAQVKSLQSQLDAAISDKKNALKLLDSQGREQKNWDNVIKEYQSVVEAKNSEIKGLKEDLSESEQANTHAKICYEELRVEMDSKEGAVIGLKKKIAELHVEVQVLLQNKIQLENEVKNVRLEMETLQKSKEWFQEQLHTTQDSRNKLHQELIALQSNLASTSNSLEKVNTEKNQLCHELLHTQQRAVAEKEVLMKHLETIEADMKERESMFDEIQNDKGTAEAVLVERIRKLEVEKSVSTGLSLTLSDQEYQVKVLKSECEEKDKILEALKKEKMEFTKQIAILQKTANDKDLMNEQLGQQIKDLNVKIKHLEMALRHSEEMINTLKEERTATDVALASANEEKRIVNESLKSVSENLNKFKHNFKIMKADLITKSSQAEQLLREKQSLEEALKKSEDNMFTLRKEFEQQVRSENQNRDVMLDDLKKKKSDVESVLNVYSKDLLNYQNTIENLNKIKNGLENEVASLKSAVEAERTKVSSLSEQNASLRRRITELEELEQNLTNKIIETSESLKESVQTPSDDKRTQILLRTKKVLYKKLKEKMKECDNLKNELLLKSQISSEEPSDVPCDNSCRSRSDLIVSETRVKELEEQVAELEKVRSEQVLLLKKSEEVIIELERQKGKATGIADKYESLKQHLSDLESSLGGKDAEIVKLKSEVKSLRDQLGELDISLKYQITNLETDLNKEKALVKGLRQQIFQEKRVNSRQQRDITTMKSALEQANQIADSKKQEIESLQAELSVKMQAEFKHRAEIEHFQTEVRLQQSIAEKLTKELEEVKARDPALAEQIKALSWRLKEKSNEVVALMEKLNLAEDRSKVEIENLKKQLQMAHSEVESIKSELNSTRDEKFSYQAKVIELRKALKSKLGELESKGILRIDKASSDNGPVIHLNVPDPEVSFDENYVNNLLQKSIHLTESRPLSNLQECLNSLKEEMVLLQKKIIENGESS